jgi:hypothetical protein
MRYIVRCKSIGCKAERLYIELESDEFPTNVICGSCESEITDIQEIISE